MSCDSGKEIASVVDSSLTEKQDIGNLDDPVSSSYKANGDGLPRGADRHSHVGFGNVRENKAGTLYGTKYFIIKSLNHQNIQLSVERGIWATQVVNESILDEAFHNSAKVILIFSVNTSGFFQGYAQMVSSVRGRRDNVWSEASGGNNPWGRNFRVKWLCLRDLPFQRTLHLKNPLNEYKPVKISRDCQELPEDIGEALCELLDGKLDEDCELKGNELLCNGLPSKRHCLEPRSLRDDTYNYPSMNMSWERAPLLHPSLLYPQEAETTRLQFSHPRSAGVYPTEDLSITYGASRGSHRNFSHNDCGLDHDMSSRSDFWGLPVEEGPLSTLTDDDFLEMSYEEYLKVHSRSRRHNSVAGKSRPLLEPSTSKEHDDQLCLSSHGDRSHSNKRSRHSSHK